MEKAKALLAGMNKKSKKKRTHDERDRAMPITFSSIAARVNELREQYKSRKTRAGEPFGDDDDDSMFEDLDSLAASLSEVRDSERIRALDDNDNDIAAGGGDVGGGGDSEDDDDDDEVDAAAPAAPAAPIVIEFDSNWTGGKKGAGSKSKSSRKKSKKDDDSIRVVPHSGAPSHAANFKAITLSQIRMENFKLNYNIIINKNDEIDLEDTSCESDDNGDEHQHKPDAVDDDDEFYVRNKPTAPAGGNDDPFDSEFDLGNGGKEMRNDVADRIRERKERRRKQKERHGDDVASIMGRMNNCFLCKWGKRSYDFVNNDHMEKLMKLRDENLGEIPLEYIAMAMHAYYKNVIKPAAQGRGQFLPVWRSKHIFICLMSHNQIPQIKLVHDLNVVDTMQGFLERKIGVNAEDSDNQIPIRQLMKELRDTMTLGWRLRMMPMAKMNFHRSDRDIKLGGDRQFFGGLSLEKSSAHAGAPLSAIGHIKKTK